MGTHEKLAFHRLPGTPVSICSTNKVLITGIRLAFMLEEGGARGVEMWKATAEIVMSDFCKRGEMLGKPLFLW